MSSTSDSTSTVIESLKLEENSMSEEFNLNKRAVNTTCNESKCHKNKSIEELIDHEPIKDLPSSSLCTNDLGKIINTSDEIIEILDETQELCNVSNARPVLNQTLNFDEEEAPEVPSFVANISFEYNKSIDESSKQLNCTTELPSDSNTTGRATHQGSFGEVSLFGMDISQIIDISNVSEKVATTHDASLNLKTANIRKSLSNITSEEITTNIEIDCNKTMEENKLSNQEKASFEYNKTFDESSKQMDCTTELPSENNTTGCLTHQDRLGEVIEILDVSEKLDKTFTASLNLKCEKIEKSLTNVTPAEVNTNIEIDCSKTIEGNKLSIQEKAPEVHSFDSNNSFEYNKIDKSSKLPSENNTTGCPTHQDSFGEVIEILDVSEKMDKTFNASLNLKTENIAKSLTDVTSEKIDTNIEIDCNKTVEEDKASNQSTNTTFCTKSNSVVVLDESSVCEEVSLVEEKNFYLRNDTIDISSEIEFSFRSSCNIPGEICNVTRNIEVECSPATNTTGHNGTRFAKEDEETLEYGKCSTATITTEVIESCQTSQEPVIVDPQEMNRTADLSTKEISGNIDNQAEDCIPVKSDLNDPTKNDTTIQNVHEEADLNEPVKDLYHTDEAHEEMSHCETNNKTTLECQIVPQLLTKNESVIAGRPDFSESCSEVLFSSALSSSVFEKCAESVCNSPETQKIMEKTKTEAKIDSLETKRSDENAVTVVVPEASFRLSAIERKRSLLLENWQPYSPSRLDLAAAFENLRINTTTEDETFLSCDNQLESSLTDANISCPDVFSENENENVESCDETKIVDANNTTNDQQSGGEKMQDVHDVPDINTSDHLPNKSISQTPTVIEEDANTHTASTLSSFDKVPSFIEENGDVEMTGSSNTDNIKPVGRKSCGYTISTMPVLSSPSPFTESLSYLDDQLYKELLTASPSVIEQKLPDYERYCALKLEINSIQQNMAKLTIDLRQKEGQIIRLRPQSVKLQPTVRPKPSIPRETVEESEQQNLISSLQAEIQQYVSEIAELKKTLNAKMEEINSKRLVEERSAHLQEEIDRKENENKSLKAQIISLKHSLISTEEIMSKYVIKLDKSEQTCKTMEQKYNNLLMAFEQVVEKYEKAKEIVLGMKSNEDILKNSLGKMQSEFNKLKEEHESCKKSPLKEIPEPNKENLKSRFERGILRRQKSK